MPPSSSPIYLDHHATTPLDPRVFDAMAPYFGDDFGNAASRTHAYGWRAEAAVDDARERITRCLGANDPSEIVFTSGATESNNLAILGLAGAQTKKCHWITVATEHPSVLDPCRALERRGHRLTILSVDGEGFISIDELRAAIQDETMLVSVMVANNEIGTLQPIAEIAEVCRERGVIMHTDAAQAAGKIDLDVSRDGSDLLSVSAHKMYGPKGVGCLRIRRSGRPRIRLEPLQYGGGHEAGLRSGTLPVPLIVGFAKAFEIALDEREAESKRLAELRDELHRRIKSELPGRTQLNGPMDRRLPGNLNLCFESVDGDRLIADLSGLAVSSGAACSSAVPEPSPVLLALGRSPAEAKASIRFGLGRMTTREEISAAADQVVAAVRAQD